MRKSGSPHRVYCRLCNGNISAEAFKRQSQAFLFLNPDRQASKRGAALSASEVDYLAQYFLADGRLHGFCHKHLKKYARIGGRTIAKLGKQLRIQRDEITTKTTQEINYKALGCSFDLSPRTGRPSLLEKRPEVVEWLKKWLELRLGNLICLGSQAIVSRSIAKSRNDFYQQFVVFLQAKSVPKIAYTTFWKHCDSLVPLGFDN